MGGSPCSGESTLAEALARHMDSSLFKVDDYLDKFAAEGAQRGFPLCRRLLTMNADEIWMRDPALQCREEFDLYTEYAPMIREKLQALDGLVITEGAAYHPELMRAWNVGAGDYLALVPTADFQVTHYRRRPWVPMVLAECRDQAAAFDRWMQRDAFYVRQVEKRCKETGYTCICQGGSLILDDLLQYAANHFGIRI